MVSRNAAKEEKRHKKIAILGSTGSIGTQACEVIEKLTNISIVALSAHSNGEILLDQAERMKAPKVCLTDQDAATKFKDRFESRGIEFFAGLRGLGELIRGGVYDLVLNAIVGSAGLVPTVAVLETGATLALANKESLVAGGTLVMAAAREHSARIIPVDSEHSAVFQCLEGVGKSDLRRIILTASGGPFRETPIEKLTGVTVAETLSHPTWSMGRKVTVDSATLMNKGLEVLEAHHLFGVDLDRIEVIIHPQSVVHSMVEMIDGSVLAQMGMPDMRTPIQYALTYPERAAAPAEYLSLEKYGALTFMEVDSVRFPCLELAYHAGRKGGTCPAALNAANEEAVRAFLEERIAFTGIFQVIENVLERHKSLPGVSLSEIAEAERNARDDAREIIRKIEDKTWL